MAPCLAAQALDLQVGEWAGQPVPQDFPGKPGAGKRIGSGIGDLALPHIAGMVADADLQGVGPLARRFRR